MTCQICDEEPKRPENLLIVTVRKQPPETEKSQTMSPGLVLGELLAGMKCCYTCVRDVLGADVGNEPGVCRSCKALLPNDSDICPGCYHDIYATDGPDLEDR